MGGCPIRDFFYIVLFPDDDLFVFMRQVYLCIGVGSVRSLPLCIFFSAFSPFLPR